MNRDLQQLQESIAAAIVGCSAEGMNWHPPGKWSAGEVLEHLYLTYTGTVKGFERVAEAGKPLATHSTWKDRGRRFVLLGFGYLPEGREAPATVRPKGLPQEKVLAEIAAKIGEMDEAIWRCEEKFGTRAKLLDHPVLGPLNGGQWRKFHLLHGLHHVKQIWRLRESAGRQ